MHNFINFFVFPPLLRSSLPLFVILNFPHKIKKVNIFGALKNQIFRMNRPRLGTRKTLGNRLRGIRRWCQNNVQVGKIKLARAPGTLRR
jgi:hypothetical protein